MSDNCSESVYDQEERRIDCESACTGVTFTGDPDGAVKALVEECRFALGWHAGFPHGGPSDFEAQMSGEVYERLRAVLARVRLNSDDVANKGGEG